MQLKLDIAEDTKQDFHPDLQIGTSGYYYNDWIGKFYPPKLKKSDWLAFYAQHFNSVEINNTFYKMPVANTLRNWCERTPDNFSFTLKGYRLITHHKKLIDIKEEMKNFYREISVMEEKLSCILWQFPPNLAFDPERLVEFAKQCSSHHKNVVEFRHLSWFNQKSYDILRRHNLIFCMISAPGKLPEAYLTTNPAAYLRFHGKDQWYDYNYSDEELEVWVKRLQSLSYQKIYIYFNNDYHTHAIYNAFNIRSMLLANDFTGIES